MQPTSLKPVARAVYLLLVLALTACSSSSTSPTTPTATPTPTPAPVVSTVVAQGSQSGVGANVLLFTNPFTTSTTGTLDVTVDWTFTSDNVDIYVSRGQCSLDQVNNGSCPFAAFSQSTTAKPETLHITGVTAGTYVLLIGNRGPNTESVSWQVVFTG